MTYPPHTSGPGPASGHPAAVVPAQHRPGPARRTSRGTRTPANSCSTLAPSRRCAPADESGVPTGPGRSTGCGPWRSRATRVQGGATGSAGRAAIVAAYDHAMAAGAPVVGLWHSGGARLADGVERWTGRPVFAAMTRASGKVAQISLVLGPAAGGAAYGPALTDVIVMTGAGRVFVTGPDVVRNVTGSRLTWTGSAVPTPTAAIPGSAHMAVASEEEGFPLHPAAGQPVCPSAGRGGQPSGGGAGSPPAAAGECPPRLRRAATGRAILDPRTVPTARAGSRNCSPAGHPTSSSGWAAWPAGQSALSPTTRCGRVAASTR